MSDTDKPTSLSPTTDALNEALCGDWEDCYRDLLAHAIRVETQLSLLQLQHDKLERARELDRQGSSLTAGQIAGMSGAELVGWLNQYMPPSVERKIHL